jgi:hypothetical protein
MDERKITAGKAGREGLSNNRHKPSADAPITVTSRFPRTSMRRCGTNRNGLPLFRINTTERIGITAPRNVSAVATRFDANYWRWRAQQTRALAAKMKHAEPKRMMLPMVAEHEKFAATADGDRPDDNRPPNAPWVRGTEAKRFLISAT